jgi:hypothetical protein
VEGGGNRERNVILNVCCTLHKCVLNVGLSLIQHVVKGETLNETPPATETRPLCVHKVHYSQSCASISRCDSTKQKKSRSIPQSKMEDCRYYTTHSCHRHGVSVSGRLHNPSVLSLPSLDNGLGWLRIQSEGFVRIRCIDTCPKRKCVRSKT